MCDVLKLAWLETGANFLCEKHKASSVGGVTMGLS